jgi:hypothetical protein
MSGVAPPPGAWAVALAVARRPQLWLVAAAALFRLARPGWWRRWPLLPIPAPGYLHLRVVTAYGGDGSQKLLPGDVVAYLEWCRRR